VKNNKLCPDKLIDAMNIEGKKNEKVFEIAKRLERELSQFPEFIGVFPFGSRTKGYSDENVINSKSGMKGSDYDMCILEDKLLKTEGLINEQLGKVGLEYRKKGVTIEFIEQDFCMKNLRDLFDMAEMVGPDYLYAECFANLCRVGLGQKLKEWRNAICMEISKLPKEKKETVLQLFSDNLVLLERKSLPKITERIPGFDQSEYMNARRQLWTKRVYKIYGALR